MTYSSEAQQQNYNFLKSQQLNIRTEIPEVKFIQRGRQRERGYSIGSRESLFESGTSKSGKSDLSQTSPRLFGTREIR